MTGPSPIQRSRPFLTKRNSQDFAPESETCKYRLPPSGCSPGLAFRTAAAVSRFIRLLLTAIFFAPRRNLRLTA